MTHAEDVSRAAEPRPLDWTQKLLLQRIAEQTKAKRQRDNAHQALRRAGRDNVPPEQLAQITAAVRLAEIELMGAVDAVNESFAGIHEEWTKP